MDSDSAHQSNAMHEVDLGRSSDIKINAIIIPALSGRRGEEGGYCYGACTIVYMIT